MDLGRLQIAGRFAIQRRAGTGGMGAVYEAIDAENGAPVAVKVLRMTEEAVAARFAREAHVLAQIHHPGVVRYVAHGVIDDPDLAQAAKDPLLEAGTPYLVMEWLEGEDLAARLAREPITIPGCLEVARRAAAALAAVHARGVVHRDVKPSNLFLRGGKVEDLVLLDFGIARIGDGERPVTLTGIMMGTPGYMAPEQARGARELGPSADVFSLGCVLFKCLTGQGPFPGTDVLEVLTKVLLGEVARARDLRPDTPRALDTLVARMLAKAPSGRPQDGASLVRALAELGEMETLAGTPPPTTLEISPRRMGGEQRLCSVVLVEKPAANAGAEASPLSEVVAAYGAKVEQLLDGTSAVLLDRVGAATDQAAIAARCALALREAVPDRAMALATGLGRVGASGPVGQAIERAARLFKDAKRGLGIRIDGLTADLLDARFEVEADEGGPVLLREHEAPDEARRLLGKATACVGRERELRALEDLFEECVSEPAATVVLVEGEAGVGKSRIRWELLQRIAARREAHEVWIARGDPMRAGAPFGLVGQLVRKAAKIVDGEPLAARREKIQARVGLRVDAGSAARVAEFLGELAGAPFPDDQRRELAAARQSPMLMGDQMRRAWVDLLDAETRAGPVVLVLEDLHWGDAPTVEHVDAALRLLKHRPLFVLALARPAVRERFPGLWDGRGVTEIRLGGLSRRASDKLARQILGDNVDEATLAGLWERSQGNAFFLEELIRATSAEPRSAERLSTEAPATVLAMLQSRLEALDADARRVLRAGSIFGQAFRRSALLALLGGEPGPLGIDGPLADLTRQEWIVERVEGELPLDRVHAFRHALVREVAYGMLTEEDRALGHRMAGSFLEAAGEPDAATVAEHFDRGGDAGRAVDWYQRAAAQALKGNDLSLALRLAERAATLGASGEGLASLHILRAEAHVWRGELADAKRWARAAMELVPQGSDAWYAAVHGLINAADRMADHEQLDALDALLSKAWSDAEVTAAQFVATERLALSLMMAGRYEQSAALHASAERVAARFEGNPDATVQRVLWRATRAFYAGDLCGFCSEMEVAIRHAEETGNLRLAVNRRYNLAWAYMRLGAYEEALATSRAALAEAERMGLALVATRARNIIAVCELRMGGGASTLAAMREIVEAYAAQGQARFEGSARARLAEALHVAGDLESAEREARRALEQLVRSRPLQPLALGHLSRVLRDRGRTEEALAVARQGAALLDELGQVEDGDELVRLALAEALDACGDRPAALAIVNAARERLLGRARTIPEGPLRIGYLERVPEHARMLALAAEWGAGAGPLPAPPAAP